MRKALKNGLYTLFSLSITLILMNSKTYAANKVCKVSVISYDCMAIPLCYSMCEIWNDQMNYDEQNICWRSNEKFCSEKGYEINICPVIRANQYPSLEYVYSKVKGDNISVVMSNNASGHFDKKYVVSTIDLISGFVGSEIIFTDICSDDFSVILDVDDFLKSTNVEKICNTHMPRYIEDETDFLMQFATKNRSCYGIANLLNEIKSSADEIMENKE